MHFSKFLLASVVSTAVSASTISNCSVASTYSVKSGDNLTGIAATNKVSLAAVEYENPQIADFDFITVGEKINIPNVGCYVDLCNIVLNYTVKSGDTLKAIAGTYNISLAALESVNTDIKNFNFISIGETIHIPSPTCIVTTPPVSTANCAENVTSTYTVVSGDTFYIIASRKLNISLAAFEYANPQVPNYDQIEVGQVLNVPVCGTCVSPSYGGGPKYTVVSGDTFFILASEKFNITLAALEGANPQVADFNKINIGDVLNVPLCCKPRPSSGIVSTAIPYPTGPYKFPNVTSATKVFYGTTGSTGTALPYDPGAAIYDPGDKYKGVAGVAGATASKTISTTATFTPTPTVPVSTPTGTGAASANSIPGVLPGLTFAALIAFLF